MSAKETSQGDKHGDAGDSKETAKVRPVATRPAGARPGKSSRPTEPTLGNADVRRRSAAARRFARRTEEHRTEIGSTDRAGDAGQDTCRRTAEAAAAPAVAAENAAAVGAGRNGIRDAASATQHRRREADRQLAGRVGGSESRAAAESGPGEWRNRSADKDAVRTDADTPPGADGSPQPAAPEAAKPASATATAIPDTPSPATTARAASPVENPREPSSSPRRPRRRRHRLSRKRSRRTDRRPHPPPAWRMRRRRRCGSRSPRNARFRLQRRSDACRRGRRRWITTGSRRRATSTPCSTPTTAIPSRFSACTRSDRMGRWWCAPSCRTPVPSPCSTPRPGQPVTELERIRDEGFFAGGISGGAWFAYRLRVTTEGGDGRHRRSVSLSAASSTDADVHLLAEGSHLQSYEKLGAHLRIDARRRRRRFHRLGAACRPGRRDRRLQRLGRPPAWHAAAPRVRRLGDFSAGSGGRPALQVRDQVAERS